VGVLTGQKINEYYERYKAIDVTFSKELIQVTGLVTNQVYLKCVGDFWPCVVFSTSFQGAKLAVNLRSGILQKLEKANNVVSLRYCFKRAEKGNPVTFFVNARSVGYSAYGKTNDVALFTLQFTQRPPDDLIEIMGRILDANVNSVKRKDERILITPESVRKLNIASKETAAFIQGVPRRCILRDISFSGAKIIMMGVAKFLVDKEASLRLDFEDPRESFLVKGKFVRSEAVEARKELIALAIFFDESVVPMGYKVRLNDYLSQFRVENRISGDNKNEKKVAQARAQAQKPPPKEEAWPSPDEAAGILPQDNAAESASMFDTTADSTQPPAASAEAFPANDDFDLELPKR